MIQNQQQLRVIGNFIADPDTGKHWTVQSYMHSYVDRTTTDSQTFNVIDSGTDSQTLNDMMKTYINRHSINRLRFLDINVRQINDRLIDIQ